MDDDGSSEEETQDVVAAGVVGSSSHEDARSIPRDRPRLWEYQMREVGFLIQQFRMAYAEEIPVIIRGLWLNPYPCDVRYPHTRLHVLTRNARERLHYCVREIRRLWNRTRRVCVRRRFCELGNVNWNLHQRLGTAAVYDLIQCQSVSFADRGKEFIYCKQDGRAITSAPETSSCLYELKYLITQVIRVQSP